MKKGRALEVRFQHTFENSVGTARTHQQQQHAALHLQLAGVSPGTPPRPTPIPAPGGDSEETGSASRPLPAGRGAFSPSSPVTAPALSPGGGH